MQIIQGVDGSYLVKDSKLVKIVNIAYSNRYFTHVGGTVTYELEDGTILSSN